MEGEVSPSVNESMQSQDEGTPTTVTKVRKLRAREQSPGKPGICEYEHSLMSRPGIVCSTTKRRRALGWVVFLHETIIHGESELRDDYYCCCI